MKRSSLKRRKPLERKVAMARSAGKALRRASPRRGTVDRPVPGPNPSARTRTLERLRARRAEPGYADWHAPVRGRCAVCKRPGPLQRHHAVQEQVIRRAGGDPWDLSWSLELGRHCDCHERHHSFGVRDTRLDFRHVPARAIRLAVETLGLGAAEDYFRRHYRNAPESLPT